VSPITLPAGITPAGENTEVLQEPVVELHEESGIVDTPEQPESGDNVSTSELDKSNEEAKEVIEELISDAEKERRDLRAAYPQFSMQFDAIDDAVRNAADKISRDQIPTYQEAVTMASVSEELRKHVDVTPKSVVETAIPTNAKTEAVYEMVKIQAGRNESDIPLNDPYWDARNRMLAL